MADIDQDLNPCHLTLALVPEPLLRDTKRNAKGIPSTACRFDGSTLSGINSLCDGIGPFRGIGCYHETCLVHPGSEIDTEDSFYPTSVHERDTQLWKSVRFSCFLFFCWSSCVIIFLKLSANCVELVFGNSLLGFPCRMRKPRSLLLSYEERCCTSLLSESTSKIGNPSAPKTEKLARGTGAVRTVTKRPQRDIMIDILALRYLEH